MEKDIEKGDERDFNYIKILKALIELPFPVGKNLLADFLTGGDNDSIPENDLDSLNTYDTMAYSQEEVKKMIDNLISNGMIEIFSGNANRFWKLLRITPKGRAEIWKPSLYMKKMKSSNNFEGKETEITSEDREKFRELDSFLSKYNDAQKKAIISEREKILCVAGAGSGKTTVLVKRIEFLVKYRGIGPAKILAITFTKKAKQEMENRLAKLGIITNVETFNSFCERVLRKNEARIYSHSVRVMSYNDKIMALMFALQDLGLGIENAVDKYFSDSQKKNKEPEQLPNIFMNDCFSILDYFKSKNQEVYDFSRDVEEKDKENARMIYKICVYLQDYMKMHGLRDYTDQMVDALKFFRENRDEITRFEHVLVDEYQDVNSAQIEMLDLLNPKNLFCVGDPRQSIFGWRGSDIKHILKFEEKYPGSEIIILKKNYRSSRHIVRFMNSSIKSLGVPDLEHSFDGEKEIKLLNFDSEEEEQEFVIQAILNSAISREEIFVLARTNRQLNSLSQKMKARGIKHVVKSDEILNPKAAQPGDITLATIHAIKGLEAKMVFVMGCNELNFPCKASDHPVIEMIKLEEYDKEEEERRLFYVAISRAKEKLVLSYSGKKPTYFINDDMKKMVG